MEVVSKKKYRRTQKILITPESIYLRQARLKKGLSIREVAKRMNCSQSLVRHIETGRLDIPRGELFDRLLTLYEIPNRKAFYERLKRLKIEVSPRDELAKIIPSLKDEQIKFCLSFIRELVA